MKELFTRYEMNEFDVIDTKEIYDFLFDDGGDHMMWVIDSLADADARNGNEFYTIWPKPGEPGYNGRFPSIIYVNYDGARSLIEYSPNPHKRRRAEKAIEELYFIWYSNVQKAHDLAKPLAEEIKRAHGKTMWEHAEVIPGGEPMPRDDKHATSHEIDMLAYRAVREIMRHYEPDRFAPIVPCQDPRNELPEWPKCPGGGRYGQQFGRLVGCHACPDHIWSLCRQEAGCGI